MCARDVNILLTHVVTLDLVKSRLVSCGVVIEQQQAATLLPSNVQQNSRAEQMNVNVSMQSSKPDASINCHPSAAVMSGKWI